MTKENLNSLARLIIMMANRPEVFVKVACKKDFAEAVMLVSPLINGMSRDEINKLRKELK
jgi:hypothetical protein